MTKKVARIAFVILLSISLLTIIILYGISGGKQEEKDPTQETCNIIINDINNKKDVILYFGEQGDNTKNNEIKKYFQETYPKITTHKLKNQDKDHSCIKEILEENDLYNELDDSSALIIYSKGEYKGFMLNANNIDQIEENLASLGIIVKQEVKEEITLKDFKEKIKKDNYLLLIVGDETSREFYIKEMKKQLSEYSYDIINIKTTEGNEIVEYVYTNFEKSNEIPKMYHFKNSVLKTTQTIYGELSITELKDTLK